MADSRHNIISSIQRHIGKAGGNYKEWHVGTCGSSEDDLAADFVADRESVVLKQAQCSEDAKAVMAYFVYIYETLRGESIGADGGRTVVYAYKKLP